MGGAAAIRWLGHSSVQIDLDGTRVLTDPALTARLGHLRRHHRVDVSTVATPDAIVISHVHLDHLHVPSLRRLGREIRIVVPAGAGRLLRRKGFPNVDEARVGDTFDVGRVTVETVPAVHPTRTRPAQPRRRRARRLRAAHRRCRRVLRRRHRPVRHDGRPGPDRRGAPPDLGLGPEPSARGTSTPSEQPPRRRCCRPAS